MVPGTVSPQEHHSTELHYGDCQLCRADLCACNSRLSYSGGTVEKDAANYYCHPAALPQDYRREIIGSLVAVRPMHVKSPTVANHDKACAPVHVVGARCFLPAAADLVQLHGQSGHDVRPAARHIACV